MGFTEHTIWGYYSSNFLPIVRFIEQRSCNTYDEKLLGEYAEMITARHENGEICRSYCGDHLKAVARMIELHNTGELEWSCKTRISKFKLNGRFEAVLEGFLTWRPFHHNTRGDFV